MVDHPGKVFWLPLVCACVVVCGVLVLSHHSTLLKNMDFQLYDVLVQSRQEQRTTDAVVVLGIDDATLLSVGQWPWPRYRIAGLLDTLREAKPALVNMDILFPEPDRASLSVIREMFAREFGLDMDFTGVPQGLTDNDGYLAEVLKSLPTVGAYFLFPDARNLDDGGKIPSVSVENAQLLDALPQAFGLLGNIPILQQSMGTSGFINSMVDADGVLRRLFLLYRYQGKLYPHMNLADLMLLLKAPRLRVEQSAFGHDLCLQSKEGLTVLRVPVQRDGSVMLRFSSGNPCPILSALDVLRGEVPSAAFDGKVVLLGATAAGLKDQHHTPTGMLCDGPVVQATFLENALSRSFPIWPDWADTCSLVSVVLAGALVTALFLFVSPGYAALGSVGLLVLFLGGTAGAFWHYGLFIPVVAPCLCIPVVALVLSLELYAREHRNMLAQLRSVAQTRQLTLESMAVVAEMRTMENDGHIHRTQEYVRILADELQRKRLFPELTARYAKLLYFSAPLHDLGKMAIPDKVLFKPGPLSPEEFEIIKTHTIYGKKVIERAGQSLDRDHFLLLAAEIALSHHEKWDGSGYPAGLAGDAIPLSGRIMALADVYDALISRRVYKEPFSHEETRRIILEGRGTHFDPRIVDAFLAREEEFIACARCFLAQACGSV